MFLLVPAYPGSRGPKAVKRLYVCVAVLQLQVMWLAQDVISNPTGATRFGITDLTGARYCCALYDVVSSKQ